MNAAGKEVFVRSAVWPDDVPAVTTLLRGYFEFLHNGPAALLPQHLQGHERELAAPSYVWGHDRSQMLIAGQDNTWLGCVGVHLLPDRAAGAEIKRLWTVPEARGMGLGQKLIREAIRWAQERSARELLLDTLPAAMPDALRLYRAMGFQECERYNRNPVPGIIYLKLAIG